MRIAYITYEFPSDTGRGGIGTYSKQVAAMLAEQGWDIHVFAGSHQHQATTIEDGFCVHRLLCNDPHDFKIKVLPIFTMEHTKLAFDLIESPEIHGNAAEIKKTYPHLQFVVRLHASNWLVESFKKKYIPLQNKLRFFFGAMRRGRMDLGYWRSYDFKNDADYCYVQKADFISAPSSQMKKWAVERWKINPERIKVVENPFVENERFKKALTNNEEHAIIFYGRLNVLKGLITATKAMKHILKNNSGWKWIIVGADGTAADSRSSMKQWMQKELKELMPQVVFYNTVAHESIPFYLQQASIVLIPSLFESYSYVTIEAMCAGKAIVGSKDTGIASLIENNVTGKLADAYKIHEWESAIQKLISDVGLRKGLGNAAYKYANNKHMVNEEILEYYKGMTLQKKIQY